LTPEQQAREKIDQKLLQAGWTVQYYNAFNPSAHPGIAVREYPTDTGSADYVLFIDRKPAGIIEAKKEGHTLSQVHDQTSRYASGKLKFIVKRQDIPFLYESTGTETYFTDARDPSPRQREIFNFHRPETLHDLLKQETTLRAQLREMPPLNADGLRLCQKIAIENLERSFAQNRPRALVQMATGAGKTFTAITSVYRLLKFGGAGRVLFLVDTRNLGKQAEQEFRAYKPVDDKRLFPELYNVQRLRSNYIDPSAHVCISTIQRMYSILKGKELDESAEDESLFESKIPQDKQLEVVYNSDVPIETFDFIIIDECHRSIYNLWKQVLDYFDAFMIGLTATPDKRTFAFFNENVVSEYSLKESIADKVNVGYDVYTIETEITKEGAKIQAKQYVDLRNKMTRSKEWRHLDDEVQYTGSQLDRDVVNPSQIRNIVREYKRILREEFFPERGDDYEVPKTLIFAKTDSHAEDIVHIVREEFGEGNDFCKKVTYNVKPIEVLIFMRDVRSRNYFQQMIGRGTRSFSRDELMKVTPSAKLNKERFYIIDAVGVFKSVKVDYPVVDKKPAVPLKDLMRLVMHQPDEENLTSLSSRFTRLDKQISEDDRERFRELSGGKSIADVANELADVFDPDAQIEQTKQMFNLSADAEPTEEQIKQTVEKKSTEAARTFDNHELRNFVETVRQKVYQVIDTVNVDRVVHSGFDVRAKENAEEILNNFRTFIDDNKDEILALRILYSQPERRKDLTYKMIKDLRDALNNPPYNLSVEQIWDAYRRVEPARVKGTTPQRILTDIISLIRFELKIDSTLEPYGELVNRRFKDWVFRRNAGPVQFTDEQMEWLRLIKDHIVKSLRIENEDFEYTPFDGKGGLGKFWKVFGGEAEKIIEEMNAELAA